MDIPTTLRQYTCKKQQYIDLKIQILEILILY